MDVPHFCVSCSIVDDSCKLTSHPCCPILYHTQNGVVLSFTEKGTLSDVDGLTFSEENYSAVPRKFLNCLLSVDEVNLP